MEKITLKDIKEVKRHAKKTWHDKEWWEFNNLEKTRCIQIAIETADKNNDTIYDIQKSAQRILDISE